ncbi:hypothetical protein ACFL6I_08590 [candidate division KSB1 bacterium]
MSGQTVFFKIEVSKTDPKHPANPEAEILAKYNGTYRRLTPKITESELDYYINLFIKELEIIRQKGKKEFKAAKKKLLGEK